MRNTVKHSTVEHSILSVTDVSARMLNQTDEILQLAVEELLRMEDEGGTPLTQKQTAKISAYTKFRKRIKALNYKRGHSHLIKDEKE